jgi:hypothetical protein
VTIRYTLDGSAPDSLRSPVYNDSVKLSTTAHLRAIAYKAGWYSSDTAQAEFLAAKVKVDTLIHLLPSDKAYFDEKSDKLIDLVKSDNNFRNGKWVGFRNNSMQALLLFNQPPVISSVSVSSLVDIGSYLMPPLSIEIWGGDDPGHLKLLNRITPEQPVKQKPAYAKIYELPIKQGTYRYLKVVANPVLKLPKWHPGKGEKGWFFADEIFVN